MYEYPFEIRLCGHLERRREAVVARQVGGGVERPGGRVLDTVLVTPGRAFDRRAEITDRSIPLPAIEAAVGRGRARRVTDAFDCHPERARSIAEAAVERGFFERELREGVEYVRQTARYPDDWFDEIVAVENKPDLGSPGALRDQLRTDVGLGVVDRVVLATESHVTGAHRNRLPDGVGIWRFYPDEPQIEVIREAEPLPVAEGGVELLERTPARTDVAVVTPAEKRRARRRIAERAYGKGWRPGPFPDCSQVAPIAPGDDAASADAAVPFCAWKGRVVDPGSDCGPDCPGYDHAESPDADPAAARDRHSPWVRDPDGTARQQSGLDRYS